MIEFIKYLLSAPEANSRFVFLVQGVAAAICVIAVAVGFIVSPTDLAIDMVMALLGGGFVASLGRNLTKRVGPQNTKETTVKQDQQ
jgi:uncharacterized membrane protein YkvA (DUF1232 family)